MVDSRTISRTIRGARISVVGLLLILLMLLLLL